MRAPSSSTTPPRPRAPPRHRLRGLRLPTGPQNRGDTDRYNHLIRLCETQEGYRNLINLVSTAFLDGFYYKPRVEAAELS